MKRWNALTQEQRKKFLPLCPDFAVELVSETDSEAVASLRASDLEDAQDKDAGVSGEWAVSGLVD